MIEIDAAAGEGGGQVVRTAIALAMCTRSAIRLHDVRARRGNPGLRAQHLAAVQAAARICDARVDGARIGSRELEFTPAAARAGRYELDIGTAGSTMLVLQTILPALSLCSGASEVVLHGGTHNPLAPSFEFIAAGWLPALERAGFHADLELRRHGFFPAGGGCVRASIQPLAQGGRLYLPGRGPLRACAAEVLLAGLPAHVAERELAVLRERLALSAADCSVRNVLASGAGNAVHVRLDCGAIRSLFVGFGARGVPAETVAHRLADDVERYLRSGAAVDARLADQLLLPLALAHGGEFTSEPPSSHTSTNAAVIGRFLPVDYRAEAVDSRRWRISLGGAALRPQ